MVIFTKSNYKSNTSNFKTQHKLIEQLALKLYMPLQVTIEPVPDDMSIVQGERWWIEVKQYDCVWHLPIQWKIDELNTARWLVDSLDWRLDEDSGRPIYLHNIDRIVESWVDRKIVEHELIAINHGWVEVA